MHRIRALHLHTQLALVGLLAVFVWFNMSYSMQPYTEHITGGWSGGVRYGFPFVCWDSSQDALARILPNGQLEMKFVNTGGVVWVGLIGNLGVLAALLASAAWMIQALRRGLLRNPQPELKKSVRLHRASYAAALLVAAAMLWINAQVEIETIQKGSNVDYEQSMGWPLVSFTASQPAGWEFARASAKAQPMIEHLRDNPSASYRLGHWHAQNVSVNCVIGGMLSILSILVCEILLHRSRMQSAAVLATSSRTSQRLKPQ